MYTGYNVYVRFCRDWDGRLYASRCSITKECEGKRTRYYVGAAGDPPATLAAEEVGPAIEEVRKQSSDVAHFEVWPDGQYEHGANPPAVLNGSGHGISARDLAALN